MDRINELIKFWQGKRRELMHVLTILPYPVPKTKPDMIDYVNEVINCLEQLKK